MLPRRIAMSMSSWKVLIAFSVPLAAWSVIFADPVESTPVPKATPSSRLAPAEKGLVIEDGDAVSWMTLNNTFAKGHNPYAPWRGILFQIGDYENSDKHVVQLFTKVSFWKDGSKLDRTITREKLTNDKDKHWIDVVVQEGGKNRPMEKKDANWIMRHYRKDGDHYDNACKPLEEVAENEIEISCQGTERPETKFTVTIPRDCLRFRQLHRYMKPEPIAPLTLWYGKKGFTLTAAPRNPPEEIHDRLVFSLNGTVTVYFDGDPYINAGKVDTVWIEVAETRNLEGNVVNHKPQHDPTWP
jgi:hypothetical protein